MRTRLCNRFRSFEDLHRTFSNLKTVRVIVVCLPPPSSANKLTINIFLDEFSRFFEGVVASPAELLLEGDFSFHVDVQNDHHVSRFIDILESLDLKQNVTDPTHVSLGRPLTWLSKEQMLQIYLFITSLSLSSRSLTVKQSAST